MDLDEDAELARALAMSRGDDVDMGEDAAADVNAGGDEEELDEEEEIRRAIALSLQEEQNEGQKK